MAKDDYGTPKYGKDFESDARFKTILDDTSIDSPVKMTEVHRKINSLAGMMEKSQTNQMKQLKGLSSTISSTAKSQSSLVEKIRMKEITSSKEIRVVEKSVQVVLGKLGYAVDSITKGAKRILLDTARTTKDAIKQYGQALKEDFNINKGNFLAMSLAKASPLFGYFAGKFMETDLFKKAAQAIRQKFGDAISFVGNKIKDLWGRSIDKFRDVYSKLPEIMERMAIVIKGLPKQLLRFMDFLNTLPKKFYKVLDVGLKFIGTLPKKLFKVFDTIVDKVIEFAAFLPKVLLKGVSVAFKTIIGVGKFLAQVGWKTLTLGLRTLTETLKFIPKLAGRTIAAVFKTFSEIVKFIPRTLLKLAGGGLRALAGFAGVLIRLPVKTIVGIAKAYVGTLKFLVSLPFKAIGASFGAIVRMSKFILSLPFKAIAGAFKTVVSIIKAPFKLLGAAFSAVRSGFSSASKGRKREVGFGSFGSWKREERNHGAIPKMQSGGFVQKEGLAQVHAAEVVAPAEKISKAVEGGMKPVSTKLDKLISILKWTAIFKVAHSAWKWFRSSKYNRWLSKEKDPQIKLASDFSTYFSTVLPKYDEIIENLKNNGQSALDTIKDKKNRLSWKGAVISSTLASYLTPEEQEMYLTKEGRLRALNDVKKRAKEKYDQARGYVKGQTNNVNEKGEAEISIVKTLKFMAKLPFKIIGVELTAAWKVIKLASKGIWKLSVSLAKLPFKMIFKAITLIPRTTIMLYRGVRRLAFDMARVGMWFAKFPVKMFLGTLTLSVKALGKLISLPSKIMTGIYSGMTGATKFIRGAPGKMKKWLTGKGKKSGVSSGADLLEARQNKEERKTGVEGELQKIRHSLERMDVGLQNNLEKAAETRKKSQLSIKESWESLKNQWKESKQEVKKSYKLQLKAEKIWLKVRNDTKSIYKAQEKSLEVLQILKKKAGKGIETIIMILSGVFSSVMSFVKGIFGNIPGIGKILDMKGLGGIGGIAGGVGKRGKGGLFQKGKAGKFGTGVKAGGLGGLGMGGALSLGGGAISGVLSGMDVGAERGMASGIAQGAISGSLSTIGGLVLGPIGSYVGKLLGDAIGKAAFGLGDWIAKNLDLHGLVQKYIIRPIADFFDFFADLPRKMTNFLKLLIPDWAAKMLGISNKPVERKLNSEEAFEAAKKTAAEKRSGLSKTPIEAAEKVNVEERQPKEHPYDDPKKYLKLNPNVNIDQLNPDFMNRIESTAKEFNEQTKDKLQINSGYRSYEEQAELYRTKPKGYAAKPGNSLHEKGLALDISSSQANILDKNGTLEKFGIYRPMAKEPWHIQPTPNILASISQKSQVGDPITRPFVNRKDLANMGANKEMSLANMFSESARGIQSAALTSGAQSQVIVNDFSKKISSSISNLTKAISGGQGGSQSQGSEEIESILSGNLA